MKIDLDKYEADIKRIDGPVRFYTKDGKDPLPSVTSLLSTPDKEAGLARWRKYTPDHEWITTRALARGTAVHEAVEEWCLNGMKPPKVMFYDHLMPALYKIMEQYVDTIHSVEIMMHNKDLGCAGTADLVCTLKNGLTVIGDYKTSEKQKQTKWMKDYFVQTMIYADMYEREVGRKIDGIMILNVYEKPRPGCFPIVKQISEEARTNVRKFIKSQSDKVIAQHG